MKILCRMDGWEKEIETGMPYRDTRVLISRSLNDLAIPCNSKPVNENLYAVIFYDNGEVKDGLRVFEDK